MYFAIRFNHKREIRKKPEQFSLYKFWRKWVEQRNVQEQHSYTVRVWECGEQLENGRYFCSIILCAKSSIWISLRCFCISIETNLKRHQSQPWWRKRNAHQPILRLLAFCTMQTFSNGWSFDIDLHSYTRTSTRTQTFELYIHSVTNECWTRINFMQRQCCDQSLVFVANRFLKYSSAAQHTTAITWRVYELMSSFKNFYHDIYCGYVPESYSRLWSTHISVIQSCSAFSFDLSKAKRAAMVVIEAEASDCVSAATIFFYISPFSSRLNSNGRLS